MTAEQILNLARTQLGITESPANSNNVKYNTDYYGHEVNGSNYAWCAAFVWWLFRECGASQLYYGGGKTAYCPTLMNYHKNQAVTGDYQPGDVIFFNFSGGSSPKHVGVCESFDGTTITTIDGNTGSGNEANGGAVLRRQRNKKYIVGAYRPAYEVEKSEQEENPVSYEQFKAYMERYRQELAAQSASMPELLQEAQNLGLTDGSRPRDLVTREEAAIMARAAARQ
jgi:hypothetical protein